MTNLALKRWNDFFGDDFFVPQSQKSVVLPDYDIEESDEHFVLSVDLPGFKKDEVSIEVDNGVLTLKGERIRETKDKSKTHYVGRSYGKFSRSFTLPERAKVDQISAEQKDGVLTVTIPKSEEAKPRLIQIRAK